MNKIGVPNICDFDIYKDFRRTVLYYAPEADVERVGVKNLFNEDVYDFAVKIDCGGKTVLKRYGEHVEISKKGVIIQ